MKYMYFGVGAVIAAGGLFAELPMLLGIAVTTIGVYMMLTGFEQGK